MFINKIKYLLITAVTVSLSCFALPVKSAEKINLVYSSLKFPLSIESLEVFAETGEITGDFRDYSDFMDEQSLEQLRRFLAKSYNFSQLRLYQIGRTSLGEDLLKQLGKVVSTHSKRNGFYAIRGAILTAAGDHDSWTVIDVLKAFPTPEIFINVKSLVQLKDDFFLYQSYREAVEKAVVIEANRQAETENKFNFADFPDLRDKGKYTFRKETVTLKRSEYRQTQDGFVSEYNFNVDFYVPENLAKPAPVVLISHGFGSVRQNYISVAEHLASYGFIVVVPEHIGSDLRYRQELLKGGLSSALSPVEYIDRPRDLSFLIDQLEELVANEPKWAKVFNLEQIGIIGDSLGGTTVLSLAGAPLNIPRLREECQRKQVIINTALILQCQASNLPPIEYNLEDDRIKAVISAHPLTSGIFGPESMAQIDIPILMTAGSDDIITPVVVEQIHPFMWLQNQPKYLLLYQPGTHFSSSKPSTEFTADYIPEVLIGRNRAISSRYFQGTVVAFMEVYLKDNQDYLPYLSASYGNFISQENDNLNISQIQQLSEETIVSAYGGELPVIINPPAVASVAKIENKISIIEEIKETGILKVAYPRNTEPFGYLDQNGDWGGFCAFYGQQLANYLTKELDFLVQPKVVVFPSNLNNRFDLVADGQVHLECGANTITEDVTKVNFSLPFFVTGTYFLIPKTAINQFNPNQSLAQSKIGVLKDSITASFLDQKYPQAQPVYFEGVEAIETAIQALENQEINAIIDDGVLLQNKLANDNSLSDKYRVVPQLPLRCDFYGLLLPKDDTEWENLVNKFMDNSSLIEDYFPGEISEKLAEASNYCLNFNNQ